MSDEFAVDERDSGRRLIQALMDRRPLTPEVAMRNAIETGRIRVNDKAAEPRQILRKGDRVEVDPLAWDKDVSEPLPDVIYEDDSVLVVNKPAGLTVVRERWNLACPFLDGILRRLRETRGEAPAERYRPRLVHRLDRDTTGAVIVALTPDAERALCEQFRNHTVRKEYLALVHGSPAEDHGEVRAPIEAHPSDKTRMQIAMRGGKPSRTLFEVGERFRGWTLVRCRAVSGRRHQVRIHMAHIGLPLVGDAPYGGAPLFLSEFKRGYKAKPDRPEKPILDRAALHAWTLEFAHDTRDLISVEAPLPKDFERALKALRKWGR